MSDQTQAPKHNRSNPARGRAFEELTGKVLAERYGVAFERGVPIQIGHPPKTHKFDLVSTDGRYAVECKRHTWPKGYKEPIGKDEITLTAALYLQHLPPNVGKHLVMFRNENERTGETLASHFVKTHGHLLRGVHVFELDEETETLGRVTRARRGPDDAHVDPEGEYITGDAGLRRIEENAVRLPPGQVSRTRDCIQKDFGGQEGTVVLITGEAFEFRLPTIEWTHGTHGPARASWLFRRIEADVSDEELRAVFEEAMAAREAEYGECRFCGEKYPPEYGHEGNVCRGCSETHLGVVH